MIGIDPLKTNPLSATAIIKHSITALLFLTLLTALVETPSLYFPYVTGKAFFFRSIIEIALVLYLLLIVRDRSLLPRRSHIVLALAGFMGILLFSNLLGEHPRKSFLGNFERMEGYLTLLHLAAYLLIMNAIFRSRAVWTLFWQASLATSIVVGVYAVVSVRIDTQPFFSALIDGFADTTSRISGSLGNSTYLGVYALLHIFIAGFLSARTLSRPPSIQSWLLLGFYMLGGVVNGRVLFHTGTRGSIVALLVGISICIAMLVVQKLRAAKFGKAAAAGIALGAMVLVAVLLGLLKHQGATSESPLALRYSNLIANPMAVLKDQDGGRQAIWKAAFSGVVEHPVLGWGQENFNYVYDKYRAPETYQMELYFDRAHNVFFDWLIAGGVLGLLGYLSLYAALLWSLWKLPKDTISLNERAVLVGLVSAYFVHNLFVFDNLVSYLLFFSLLAYIQSTHELALPPALGKPLLNSAPSRYCATLLISAAGAITFYTVNIVPFKANTDLRLAFDEHTQRHYFGNYDAPSLKMVHDSFVQALSHKSLAAFEIREQLAVTAIELSRLNEHDFRPKFYGLAVSELLQMHANDPTNIKPASLLGLVYSAYGNYREAIVYFDKVVKLAPGRLVSQIELGVAYYNHGGVTKDAAAYDTAFSIFKKIYTDHPNFELGRNYYAMALLHRGGFEEFDAMVAQYPDLPNALPVLKALIDTQSYARALPALERSFAKQSDFGLMIHLAEAYLKTDMRDKALLLLQRAEKKITHPQALERVSNMIKAIQGGATSVLNPELPQQKP